MKHSEKHKIAIIDVVALTVPLLLIIPNIALDITDSMTWWAKMLNIIVPLSFYGILFSLFRRTPVIVLLTIPMMCFAGFQIVLIYLYGGSIIGVDMFLNVVTTNAEEVNELLGNLIIAIGAILLLYIPPLTVAVIGIFHNLMISEKIRPAYIKVSLILFVLSSLSVAALTCIGKYSPADDLFPVNIFKNLYLAFERVQQADNYQKTSSEFAYDAHSQRNPELRETYVLIIGETSRAANWQLGGYTRETNPRLSKINNLYYFPKAISQSNTTHKSVPMMISDITAETFDSINYHKSIISAFKEAGFRTSFFSNQKRNHSYTEFFADEADTTIYLSDLNESQTYDSQLLENLRSEISDTINPKHFIILHTYGSHFNYRDRYMDAFSHFKPDNIADANSNHRKELINAFDNTIRFVDSVLADAIDILKSENSVSALFYAADHGEDIFDDERNRFLHASPIPTYYQLHVPMIVWMSQNLDSIDSNYKNAIMANVSETVTPSEAIFHSLLNIAGINTSRLNYNASVVSKQYTEPALKFINDRNKSLTLKDAGLRSCDIETLKRKSILK